MWGPRGSDIRLKIYTRLLGSGLWPSRTRLKDYTPIFFIDLRLSMFFLRKGRRAQRAENFDAIS